LNKQNHTTPDRVVLALDTSSKTTSLAITRGAELVKSIDLAGDEKRSERLWSETQSLLAEARVSLAEVDLFSVCVGPGGFTGLRVGMAALKGFAIALNKPVIGVTSLEAAAFAAGPAPSICAMVNAYKNEVYSQLFSVHGDGIPLGLNDPLVSSFEKALERVADLKELIFSGDGAVGGTEVIERMAGAIGDVAWVLKRPDHCSAEDIARIGLLSYDRGQTGTVESLKACYVRPAEAEIKLSLGLLGSKIKRSMRQE
jgi:tRNA threonylcarbamoyladenosine biosynthesis protein TsaB